MTVDSRAWGARLYFSVLFNRLLPPEDSPPLPLRCSNKTPGRSSLKGLTVSDSKSAMAGGPGQLE